MALFFENTWWQVTLDSSSRLLRATRTGAALANVAEIARYGSEVSRAFDALDRGTYSLLVDLREAPLRTDSEFEAAIAKEREKILGGFRKVVLLVKSSVGKLQVNRHAKEDRRAIEIFQLEADALRAAQS